MKLTVEQIRQRVAGISFESLASHRRDAGSRDILKLIEDITGEKLPEPFDESEVKHGSVWNTHSDNTILIEGERGRFTRLGSDGRWADDFEAKEFWVRHFKSCGSKYIGQYDFTAGLPKQS